MSFEKILIANRGEIACRVMRTARQMGIATVAIYSDADAGSKHVQMADEAVNVGAAASADSYLQGQRIIDAAKNTGARAIRPGFGFLSENADFCEAVKAAGLVWIGPPTGAILGAPPNSYCPPACRPRTGALGSTRMSARATARPRTPNSD